MKPGTRVRLLVGGVWLSDWENRVGTVLEDPPLNDLFTVRLDDPPARSLGGTVLATEDDVEVIE